MRKLNPDEVALVEFVAAVAPALPAQRRIRVYRGLADCLEVKWHRLRLQKQARILEAAERACAELNFRDEPANPKT